MQDWRRSRRCLIEGGDWGVGIGDSSRRGVLRVPGLVGCSFSHRDHGPLLGGRCPEGADEGTGEASSAHTLRVASRRTLTPTPLPRGEGLKQGIHCWLHVHRGLGVVRRFFKFCFGGCRRSLVATEVAPTVSLRGVAWRPCGRDFSPDALQCAEASGAAQRRRRLHPQNENGPRKAARLRFDACAAYADRCSIAATLPRRSPRRLSRARRLRRSAGSSALTITPSKNASTCGRSRARKFSTVT